MTPAMNAMDAHRAYLRRLEAEFGDSYGQWLLEILGGSGYGGYQVPEQFDRDAEVYVLEYDARESTKFRLTYTAIGEVPDDFVRILTSEISSKAIRLVVVYHVFGTQRINFEFVGSLCHVFDVDPQLLLVHFYHRSYDSIENDLPPWYDSNSTILHLSSMQHAYLSACLKDNTVIIFYAHRIALEPVLDPLEPLVTQWSRLPDSCVPDVVIPSPIEFVAMAWEKIVLATASEISERDSGILMGHSPASLTRNAQLLDRQYMYDHWHYHWERRIVMSATARNLSAAFESPLWNNNKAPKARTVLKQYEILVQQQLAQGEHYTEGIQQIEAMNSLIEAKRASQQSESVRRLTFVAFIFLPLNFATSFFGMNMHQFGQGSVGLGYFFIVAALVSGIASLLALTLKPIEFRFEQSRKALRAYYRSHDRRFGDAKIQTMDLIRHSYFANLLWEKYIGPRASALDSNFHIRRRKPGPRFRDALLAILRDRWRQARTACLGPASRDTSDISNDSEQGRADEHDTSSDHNSVLDPWWTVSRGEISE